MYPFRFIPACSWSTDLYWLCTETYVSEYVLLVATLCWWNLLLSPNGLRKVCLSSSKFSFQASESTEEINFPYWDFFFFLFFTLFVGELLFMTDRRTGYWNIYKWVLLFYSLFLLTVDWSWLNSIFIFVYYTIISHLSISQVVFVLRKITG